MAQNPYLQNLLGINPPGMGLMRYEYTMPNQQSLLNQGLTPSDIAGKDPYWGRFGQYPFVLDPATNQVSVPGQAPGVTPITTDTQTDTVSESVTPSGVDYSSNVQDTVSTPYGTFDSNDFTQDIFTYPTGKPMNQMTEQELIAFGKAKGYIDKDSSRMMGPMQNTLEGKGLWGSMLSGPAQMLNDRQYNNYIDALSGRGMYSQGGPGEMSMMSFSPKYRETLELSKTLNDNNYYTKYNKVEGTSNIPGTFKKVSTLMNQYAPSGIGDNELVYHTSSGGHYQNDGKFVTGYGQVVASGSMQDAIDTIKAAAESGDTSTIPNKLNQEWYDKIVNAKANHLKPYQKDLKESWKKIKDTSKKDTSKTTYKDTAQDKQEKKDQVKKETAKYKDTAKTGAKAGYSYGL